MGGQTFPVSIFLSTAVFSKTDLKLFELFLNAEDRDGVEEVRRRERLSGAAENHLDQNHDQFDENHIHDNQSDDHIEQLDENHDNYHRDDAGHHNQ